MVTLTPVLMALLRVAVVAKFDQTTGYALLSSSPPFVVLGSVVYDNVPYALGTGTVIYALYVVWPKRNPSPSMWISLAVLTGVVVFALPLSVLGFMALGLAAGLCQMLIHLGGRTVRPQEGWAGIALAALAINVVANQQPWMPAERLALTNGQDLVGYVVREGGDTVTLLLHSPRVVTRTKAEKIESRNLCIAGSSTLAQEGTLWDLLFARSEDVAAYPPC